MKKLSKVTAAFAAAAFMLWGTVGSGAAQSNAATNSLDFEMFKTRVQPIFLKRRAGHARCYVCHAGSTNRLSLEKLSPGSSSWTEEQSRRNFESVSKLVTPGDPSTSRFVMHPLAPEAGGDPNHGGGRQFESKDDPDWQTIVDWVRAGKSATSSQ